MAGFPEQPKTETSIWLNIYQVSDKASASPTPWRVWEEDEEENDEELWLDPRGFGIWVIRFGGPLATYRTGAMAELTTKTAPTSSPTDCR